MTRFFRMLWWLWLLGTALWVGFVLLTAEIRPTLADLGFLITSSRPPLAEYVDPSLTCGQLTDPSTTILAATLQDRDDFPERPRYDPDAPNQYEADFAAWEREADIYNFNWSLDRPHPTTWFCAPGPYTEAYDAYQTATRPWRAAFARLYAVFWQSLFPPLGVLAVGLFFLWDPFRRRRERQDLNG